MRSNLDTIPMMLNEEGVYVMDRTARVNLDSEDDNPRGPVSFFKRFDETLEKIRKEGSKRRYYTQ